MIERDEELRRETEIELRDVFLLSSIRSYFNGTDRNILPRTPLLGRRGSRRAYKHEIARVRKQFKIPDHIPYEQFKDYLLVLEGRLECRLNKT